MKKIKVSLLFLLLAAAVSFTKAQSLEDGKKFLYYEKYKSAAAAFQKLVDANPNNTDAVYWLGQTWLADTKNIAAAKALYQKTLDANSNNALLTAAMGHIALLEGNTQDARSRFETAISLSKGKDIAVLNAIGFANADFDSKAGDAGYAIDKLKQATQIKGFKDPDVYANLGDAYRKLADGGNALLSYQAALALDPKYARAPYRIGRIYQTQGPSQYDIMMKYYDQAMALDPNYTPVYYTLFQYNYDINVPKSAEYLEKYLAAKGSDATDACYLRSSLLYAQGLFQQAIDKANECIAAGGDVNPALYGQIGYAYNRLGDSAKAKAAFDTYFQKQAPDKIGSGDYKTYAEVLLKIPGNEALAGTYLDKAIAADSTEAGKVALMKSIATKYEAQKNYIAAADWYNRILTTKKDPTKTDLYYAGYDYYLGGQYQKSIDIFNTYAQKFPNESFGFYMNGKNYAKIDSLDASGSALGNYVKVVDMTDQIKDKPGEIDRIKGSLRYLIEYYANVKRDKDSAMYYTDKGVALDPAGTEFQSMKDQLSKMTIKPAPAVKTTVTVNSKGEKVTTSTDGTVTTVSKDGLTTTTIKAGKVTTVKNGVTTIIENGKITTIDKNGKSTTVEAPKTPATGNNKK